MVNNIIRKTPSGNYMILNYAIIDNSKRMVKVPVVDSLSAANSYIGVNGKSKQRYCLITKEFYDRL